MELTLGPILFEWKKEEVDRFYEEVRDMDVDRVYVGEVICTKKLGLSPSSVEKTVRPLEASGKKVTLSSLAIVSNEQELEYTRNMVSMHSSIEANDMSVLNIANTGEKEVFSGPHITSYNAPSIEFLKSIGIKRVTFPVELPKESIVHNIRHTSVDSEVFAHGKVPLAFSWRCYTSRAFGLTKTDCRHHCARYPDGMEIKTMDGEPVFSINGTSLLSARTYTLMEYVEELKDIGVKAVRVSPQYKNTGKILELFRKRIAGLLGPEEGMAKLEELGEGPFCNGWFLNGAGKDYLSRKLLAR